MVRASSSPLGRMFITSTMREQVAPVAEKAQALDEKALDEDHRRNGAEHAREPAEDGIGNGESRQQDREVRLLDVRRVVRVEAPGETGDGAARSHGRDLDGCQIDAAALRRDLVLADGAQHGTGPRAVHPPQRGHDECHDGPDEDGDVQCRPSVLGEVADLPEAFAAERADAKAAARDLVVEVEEEEPHDLREGNRRDDQHEPVDTERGEADQAGREARDQRTRNQRRDQRPAGEHCQHGGNVGADCHETCLRERDLPCLQNHIGGETKLRVHAHDLEEAEIEIHCLLSLNRALRYSKRCRRGGRRGKRRARA